MESKQVQEWMALGEARGEARGFVKGALPVYREDLLFILEQRFWPLPEPLVRKIEGDVDLERFRAAFRQALRLKKLDDLCL
jgi:hypothetical protein